MKMLSVATFAVATGLIAGQYVTAVGAITGSWLSHFWAMGIAVAILVTGLSALAIAVGWFTRSLFDPNFSPSTYRTLVTALNSSAVCVLFALVGSWQRGAVWEIGIAACALGCAAWAGSRKRYTKNDEASAAHHVDALRTFTIAAGALCLATVPLIGTIAANLVAGVLMTSAVAVTCGLTVSMRRGVRAMRASRTHKSPA